MEEIIKKLYESYEVAQNRYCETKKLFGDDWKTTAAFHEMLGLQEAFEIVSGMTTVDYLISQLG